MKIIFTLIYFIITIIPVIILLMANKLLKFNPTTMYKILITWYNGLAKTYGVKIKHKGREKLENLDGFLIVANHQSNFDSFAIGEALNRDFHFRFIGKKEMGDFFFLRWLVESVESYLMDRNDPKQSLKIISKAANDIKDGKIVLIFPAGTRSSEHLSFKTGSFKIAQKAKAPIVPITIIGTRKFYEENKKLNNGEAFVYFHDPIPYEEYRKEALGETAKKIENLIYEFNIDDYKAVK